MTIKTSPRVPSSIVWLLCFLAVGFVARPAHAVEPAEVDSVIHLTNGDFVTGQLADSQGREILAWQSSAFTTPFQFPMPTISSVQFPVPAKLIQPEGQYCFELAGGDVLFGTLVELNGDDAVLEVSGVGRLHVDRASLRRMYRWHGGAEILFFGPSGIKGWQTSGNATGGWHDEGGNLVSEQNGSVIRRDFGIPAQSRFEFELSWKGKADFEFALGVGDAKSAQRAFRFEVWDSELVIQRETELEADLTSLQAVNPGSGRVHLQAFMDQKAGRILVFSSGGQQLADLTVSSAKPTTLGGVQLTNKTGDIRLERLSISRWNGELPRKVESDKSRIHTTDGSITYGQLKSYDAERKEFVIQNDGAEVRVADGQLQDMFFAQDTAATERALRAVYLNGQRISGDVVRVEQNKLVMKSPGIREELACPLESLQSLTTLGTMPARAEMGFPVGRLELDGLALRGNLVETEKADANCLIWKPVQSMHFSPLRPGVSARIVYRESAQKPQAAQPQARVVAQAGVARVQVQSKSDSEPATKPRVNLLKPVLHLRSGDTIPCDITAIDENGVTFSAANTDSTFIRHDQLKVLELFPGASPVQIPKSKKERLLMLPRMQRDNPPTHLIRSVDGDYLRGRLVSMDEQQLQVEIRLEVKALHRDRVARIIWFHPDELDGNTKPPSASEPLPGTRVQALPKDGNRLTFYADQVAGNFLSGRSELLGGCRVDLQQIDQLLIGPAIEQSASTLAFHQWRLKAAVDPLAARDDAAGNGDGGEGQDAALVGKMAPDFELDMLDGSKFRLSERKNKIVVLDFWASWCGPCLQVMPQIDKVVHEFADRDVELVAVNLEETGEKVQAALERLKLKMPVALDRNGRIAEKYGASSIPQTVIVDRNGKVARLFVGGGPRFGDQLRAALEAVMSDKPDNDDKTSSTAKSSTDKIE